VGKLEQSFVERSAAIATRRARRAIMRCGVFRITRVQASDVRVPQIAVFGITVEASDGSAARLLAVANFLCVASSEVGVPVSLKLPADGRGSIRPFRKISVEFCAACSLELRVP
jgi:hypothetical protein